MPWPHQLASGGARSGGNAPFRPSGTEYQWFERAQCEAVTPHAVLERLCGRIATDEPLYLTARARFDARMAAAGGALGARVALLREAGAVLEQRAKAQEMESQAGLAKRAGTALLHKYTMSSGGGVPWVVDEFSSWYRPHDSW